MSVSGWGVFGFNWVGVNVGVLGYECVYVDDGWYTWAVCEIVCGCILRECV